MERIKTGDRYEYAVNFRQADVAAFAKITGDNNPIHLDDDYAKATPFGRPVVHGFLAGAVFSKVFGTIFPGEGTIYLAQELVFRAPVFVDEPYVASFEVLDVNTERHRGLVRCALVNADGKICIDGQARLLHPDRF
jgi:acyl dehydratase